MKAFVVLVVMTVFVSMSGGYLLAVDPVEVTVSGSPIDYTGLAESILTIIVVIMAAVAGVILAIAVGKAVIRWFTRAARA